MVAVIDALMRHAIDYAGVFPPAQLSIARAVGEYCEFRQRQHGWTVGPLVVPSDRLHEPVLDRSLPLSVVVRERSVGAVEAVVRAAASLNVVALEFPPLGHRELTTCVEAAPPDTRCFVEVTPDEELEIVLDRVAATGAFAKIRTGGVRASAFPEPEAVCRFMSGCIRRRLPWKATAGLHHAVTGEYPLTYEEGSPTARMFGFLNLFAAAALTHIGVSEREVVAALTDTFRGAVDVDGAFLTWGGYQVSSENIEATRQLFLSFGSCSVHEPISELQRMGLL